MSLVEKKAHVRDVLSTRLFMRALIEEVGPETIEKTISRTRLSSDQAHSFLLKMYQEEFNVTQVGKKSPDKLYWKYVDDDVQVLVTPEVDFSILRREEEEEEEEDKVVEVVVIPDDDEKDAVSAALATPPKPNSSLDSTAKSPCNKTPDAQTPKVCRKRAKKNYPSRSSSKKLKYDKCVGCSP